MIAELVIVGWLVGWVRVVERQRESERESGWVRGVGESGLGRRGLAWLGLVTNATDRPRGISGGGGGWREGGMEGRADGRAVT